MNLSQVQVANGWNEGQKFVVIDMDNQLIAKASIRINTTKEQVWQALVDPEAVRHYIFGAEVISDWQAGSKYEYKDNRQEI